MEPQCANGEFAQNSFTLLPNSIYSTLDEEIVTSLEQLSDLLH